MKKVIIICLYFFFISLNVFGVEQISDFELQEKITCKLLSNEYFLTKITNYNENGFKVKRLCYYNTDNDSEYQIQIDLEKEKNIISFVLLIDIRNDDIEFIFEK